MQAFIGRTPRPPPSLFAGVVPSILPWINLCSFPMFLMTPESLFPARILGFFFFFRGGSFDFLFSPDRAKRPPHLYPLAPPALCSLFIWLRLLNPSLEPYIHAFSLMELAARPVFRVEGELVHPLKASASLRSFILFPRRFLPPFPVSSLFEIYPRGKRVLKSLLSSSFARRCLPPWPYPSRFFLFIDCLDERELVFFFYIVPPFLSRLPRAEKEGHLLTRGGSGS